MKKCTYVVALLALGMGSTVALRAQTGSSAPITAIGCVNRAVADGSLTGSPGVPPASPNVAPTLANSDEPTGVLLLNDATISGATDATTGNADAERPRSFQLDGARSDLERHVGHQVEVKGTLQAAIVGTSGAPLTKVDHITVTTVRMLASSCKVQEQR